MVLDTPSHNQQTFQEDVKVNGETDSLPHDDEKDRNLAYATYHPPTTNALDHPKSSKPPGTRWKLPKPPTNNPTTNNPPPKNSGKPETVGAAYDKDGNSKSKPKTPLTPVKGDTARITKLLSIKKEIENEILFFKGGKDGMTFLKNYWYEFMVVDVLNLPQLIEYRVLILRRNVNNPPIPGSEDKEHKLGNLYIEGQSKFKVAYNKWKSGASTEVHNKYKVRMKSLGELRDKNGEHFGRKSPEDDAGVANVYWQKMGLSKSQYKNNLTHAFTDFVEKHTFFSRKYDVDMLNSVHYKNKSKAGFRIKTHSGEKITLVITKYLADKLRKTQHYKNFKKEFLKKMKDRFNNNSYTTTTDKKKSP